MGSDTEARLLQRCREGHAEAWDKLFALFYAPAGRFVFQLSGDLTREDVEEICQDAFLAVIRNINSFQGTSQFQTWLFRIAGNKARDFLEKRQAAKRGGPAVPLPLHETGPDGSPAIDPPSHAPDPGQMLAGAEQCRLVRLAVEQLELPCREIIELRYFGDLSYEELAATLELNPKTVSSRLSKCLDRLELLVKETFSGGKPQFSRLTHG